MRFGFDGTDYEIDLSGKNARSFRKQLAPFIEPPAHGRPPTGAPGADRQFSAPQSRLD